MITYKLTENINTLSTNMLDESDTVGFSTQQ